MDERERVEALARVARRIELMPPTDEIGRAQWVQQSDGQWVREGRAGYDLLDVGKQAVAGEESQAAPDDEHVA